MSMIYYAPIITLQLLRDHRKGGWCVVKGARGVPENLQDIIMETKGPNKIRRANGSAPADFSGSCHKNQS